MKRVPNHIAHALLRRYTTGRLSARQQHEVEKAALANQVTNDTLDGLEALQTDQINEKVALAELRTRLHQRIRSERRFTVLLRQYASVAAMMTLTVGLGWYWFSRPERTEMKQPEMAIAAPKPAEKETELVAKVPLADAQNMPIQKQTSQQPLVVKRAEIPVLTSKEELLAGNEKVVETVAEETIPDAPNALPEAPALLSRKAASSAVPSAPRGAAPSAAPLSAGFLAKGQLLSASDKTPIPGATVTREGFNQDVTTDSNGRFELPNIQKGDKLNLGFIGYLRQEITVKDSLLGVIEMKEDETVLSEVVVTGYGKKIKNKTQNAAPAVGWKVYQKALRDAIAQFKNANPDAPTGRIVVTFMVNKNGELSDFQVSDNSPSILAEAAINIVKQQGRWIPQYKNAQPVKSQMRLSLRF
jgi:CarboxypepD_reg-like domain/Gram-negative bacterial TonB protein C-terminal